MYAYAVHSVEKPSNEVNKWRISLSIFLLTPNKYTHTHIHTKPPNVLSFITQQHNALYACKMFPALLLLQNNDFNVEKVQKTMNTNYLMRCFVYYSMAFFLKHINTHTPTHYQVLVM